MTEYKTYLVTLTEKEAEHFKDYAVELIRFIRCKDCRFSRSTNKKNVLTCIIHGFGVHVDPEGFCDSAKEKGGNHA